MSIDGGESSRTAMMRGIAVVNEVMQNLTNPAVIVTHGNLMALILKHFDEQVGYVEWSSLQNPDVYCVRFSSRGVSIERMIQSFVPAV